jgi:hypothetical protein
MNITRLATRFPMGLREGGLRDGTPADHDNQDHLDTFVYDGDGTQRRIWVIANGASDPADATADDLIFEESA